MRIKIKPFEITEEMKLKAMKKIAFIMFMENINKRIIINLK
jgi:hypothetical protein